MLYKFAMFMRFATLISLTLLPLVAGAIPLVKPSCNETGYQKGFRELVQKVAIIGEDSRVAVEKLKDQKKLRSDRELETIKRNVGWIRCPVTEVGVTPTLWNGGTATLINVSDPNNSVESTTLITSAHTFFLKDNKTPVTRLSECYFTNRFEPTLRHPLNLKDRDLSDGRRQADGRFAIGSFNFIEDYWMDRAVVQLKKPIAGSKGLMVSSKGIGANEEILNISAPPINSKGFNAYTQLVGQVCLGHETVEASRGTAIKTDCDAEGGASGSPLFSRIGNKLAVVGTIFETTIDEAYLNKPYDPYDNATVGAIIDTHYLADIAYVAGRRPPIVTANASVSF